jgi:hypothetical protein
LKRYQNLIVVSLSGLVILACRLTGILQQNIETTETPTTVVVNTPLPTLPPMPTPTTDPAIAAQTCLAGTWEISDLSAYILAAIPPDLASQYALQYQSSSGEAYFTLTPDGEFIMQADQLQMLFEAKVSIFKAQVSVKVDGEATGMYTVQDDTLTTSNVDTSGLQASAQALGNDLVDPAQLIRAIPLIQPPSNSAEFTCAGDQLQLKISSYPESIPPLVFQRAK